ncbi:MAG TPA: class I SAM-dependent methyltransferase [Candidatus Limnocylindrales bacterium]|nr:class I SAM-dependent methyltransferase [Candidatus Limnocylindrales bacterium]
MAGKQLRPGEADSRDIRRDERAAVNKALRSVGKVRTVLDVACGNGRWSDVLARGRGRSLVDLDISAVALEAARQSKNGTNIRGYVRGDAGTLPFSPQSFDLVVCLEFLCHVRGPGRLRALREMRRVSRRWVLVEYQHREGLKFAWQRVRRRMGLEARFPRNHLSREQIDVELRRAGLGIKHIFPVGGAFSRRWIIVAEAPSPAWLAHN